MRVAWLCLLMATSLMGQYRSEPAGPPPSELSPQLREALEAQGVKVVGQDGSVWAEFWFARQVPQNVKSSEVDVTWNTVPHGALVGVVRFPSKVQDRRGQTLEPGVYTLRFSYWPVDGAHQGVEPNRDALVLSPASIDTDPSAQPNFDKLMDMSRQASKTRHPAFLSMWKAEEGGDWQPGVTQMDDSWVLHVRVSGTPISVIVKGVNPHG